ncbi:hypothetical protein Tco_1122803 [Tanacetum coccineum]|uniref:Secreted protein n=1 Tax=Tanacetum coccineum TaxID=301880 RepID=A0ABQ5AJ92_9ASTR
MKYLCFVLLKTTVIAEREKRRYMDCSFMFEVVPVRSAAIRLYIVPTVLLVCSREKGVRSEVRDSSEVRRENSRDQCSRRYVRVVSSRNAEDPLRAREI